MVRGAVERMVRVKVYFGRGREDWEMTRVRGEEGVGV